MHADADAPARDSIAAPAIEVAFPIEGFGIEAVKRAAYMLMARVQIDFVLADKRIVCTLTPVTAAVDLQAAERDFRREVLDQDLRLSMEAQTSAMRDVILGLAFSRTGLQDG
jgi:His-Xaa-Ser system protein HxsD